MESAGGSWPAARSQSRLKVEQPDTKIASSKAKAGAGFDRQVAGTGNGLGGRHFHAGDFRAAPGAGKPNFPKSRLTPPAVCGLICAPLGKNLCTLSWKPEANNIASARATRLKIERLPVEAGKPVTFDRVLLVNADGKVTVGSPTVTGATVVADVVEHIRGEKKLTFKMKRRKGYHKTIGHRQELTVVKVKEIKAA